MISIKGEWGEKFLFFNNLCEANIKSFATARRVWLFADTPKGVKANVILYILVESAHVNNLDVNKYLKYLLIELPNGRYLEYLEVLELYCLGQKHCQHNVG